MTIPATPLNFITPGLFLCLVLRLVQSACQPPDSPEGGTYSPKQPKYLPGDKVVYTCKERLTRIGKDIRVCQTAGKWSASTPFCDSPSHVRNPSASLDPTKQVSHVIDGNPNTCFQARNATGQNLKVYLDTCATVNLIRLFLPKGRVNFRISLLQRKQVTTGALCTTFDRDIDESQWVTLECKDFNFQADFVVIQDSSDKRNTWSVCEIEVFVKDDVWCKHPPEVFIPHGRLEVSRDKATLICAEGYRESTPPRMVCEKSSWEGGINLQCEEILCDQSVWNGSQSHGGWHLLDNARKFSVGTRRKLKCNEGFRITGKPEEVTCLKHGGYSATTAACVAIEPDNKPNLKIIAVAVGSVIVAIIFFLLGLTLFLIQKKRSREVVVIYKPGEDGYAPPSLTSGTTACSEAEYSSIYYEGMRSPPYPPIPARSPHPDVDTSYSLPYDSSTLSNSNTLPADIAFGTLKSSALYGAKM